MKQRLADWACWLGIFVAACFLVLALTPSAWAQTVGAGLICDSPQQVEKYISLYKKGDDGDTVLKAVNTEAGSETACGFVLIAFHEGEEVSRARGANGPVRIVKITIVGVNMGRGWQPTMPFEQYTAIPVEEVPS